MKKLFKREIQAISAKIQDIIMSQRPPKENDIEKIIKEQKYADAYKECLVIDGLRKLLEQSEKTLNKTLAKLNENHYHYYTQNNAHDTIISIYNKDPKIPDFTTIENMIILENLDDKSIDEMINSIIAKIKQNQ